MDSLNLFVRHRGEQRRSEPFEQQDTQRDMSHA